MKNCFSVTIKQTTNTVSHKKRATLFLIITPSFLDQFLYFLYRWKQEGILYKVVSKIYHFTLPVSPHYLVKLKQHINSRFLMPIITVSSIGWVVRNFSRKSSNVHLFSILGRKFFYQSSVRKTFTFLQAFDKIFKAYNLNLTYFILRSNSI